MSKDGQLNSDWILCKVNNNLLYSFPCWVSKLPCSISDCIIFFYKYKVKELNKSAAEITHTMMDKLKQGGLVTLWFSVFPLFHNV